MVKQSPKYLVFLPKAMAAAMRKESKAATRFVVRTGKWIWWNFFFCFGKKRGRNSTAFSNLNGFDAFKWTQRCVNQCRHKLHLFRLWHLQSSGNAFCASATVMIEAHTWHDAAHTGRSKCARAREDSVAVTFHLVTVAATHTIQRYVADVWLYQCSTALALSG